ncbi:MAG: site-specific DNA-methyltransferase [Spirochaetes bacterium]|nr:MAG: site-specific DNA-methyltransferase [Spirochaetota bacterium]
MKKTTHKIYFADSRDLSFIESESVDLVVTSPPYPMIEMWDELFKSFNGDIRKALDERRGATAFNLMHLELNKVWDHLYRILKEGGIACINIGDATRKLGDEFRLYSNHSRVLVYCSELGFSTLPLILWRKQTNAPNKFMGSGMLPPGAYVTLEHEYILILRKKGYRRFYTGEEKLNRQESSFFWEERNTWFSDIWDLKGTRQNLNHTEARERSGAFPFEIAYRLINMFSVKDDLVLDPFFGTGTTMYAAMASERNSTGVEIDSGFKSYIEKKTPVIIDELNRYTGERLQRHLDFIEDYKNTKGELKHTNIYYEFPVITSQEKKLKLNYIERIEKIDGHLPEYRITYLDRATLKKSMVRDVEKLPFTASDDQLGLPF